MSTQSRRAYLIARSISERWPQMAGALAHDIAQHVVEQIADGPHAGIVVRTADEATFFLPVPCGHPQDPVARWVKVNFLEPHECPLCHCGRVLNEALGHVVEGAPGPIVNCDNCGCHVAIPPKE